MLIPQDIMQQWLEMSNMSLHCFPHFLMFHNCFRVAIVYGYNTGSYTPVLNPVIKMLAAEINCGEKTSVKSFITDGPIGLRGIARRAADEIGDLSGIDAVIIPDRDLYDANRDKFTRSGSPLKCFWLGDIITDIYQAAVLSAPLVRTLYGLRAAGHDVLFVLAPLVQDLKRKSTYENWLLQNNILNGGIGRVIRDAFPRSGLAERYGFEQYCTICSAPVKLLPNKDYFIMDDCVSGDFSIVNNTRTTTGQPEEYDYCVHVFGNSAALGMFLADSDTSSSGLQANINKSGINARVINHSMDAASAKTVSLRINDTYMGGRDKIVVILPKSATASVHTDFYADYYIRAMESSGIPVLYTQSCFEGLRVSGELFLDARHLNHNGNKKLGALVYEHLFSEKQPELPDAPVPYFGVDEPPSLPLTPVDEWFDPISAAPAFREYLGELRKIKSSYVKDAQKIGAIVVNCNPFTLGHRYLIEYAASRVDFLFIFVVEEDLSVFPFEDRIDLVDKGTEDLQNVGVLESGRFIISTLTFPEYFIKGEKQGAHIDPSADVELFGQYIAPALGISVRFAGTEPNDSVTRQYNEAMSRLLPRFGIEFREIERILRDGEPISASRVRTLLEKRDFAGIEKLVPHTTLCYLRLFADTPAEREEEQTQCRR